MKKLLDPICSLVWDMLANLCMFAQETFTTKWLIILGIIFIAVSIFCFYYMADGNERGKPIGTVIFAILFFFALFINIIIIAFANFKSYSVATAGDDSDWIFVSIMWGLFLCMIVASYYEKVFWIAVVLSISMIVAAALFSKFAVGIGILLVLGALGGGPTFVGTFTDRNGNSYDVYKNN